MKRVCVALSLCWIGLAAPSLGAIYGEDDRLEHFEVKKAYKAWARSIAAIVPAKHLERQADGSYRWRFDAIPTLGQTQLAGRTIDPKQRFVDQPLCGVGTAFLIAPDTIVTAGHCVINETGESVVTDMVIVFDYHIDAATQKVSPVVPAENVFRCSRALTVKHEPASMKDFAIVRLDRRVEGRPPLKARSSGRIADRSRLVLIGHPLGLPSKVTINARVRNNDPKEFFLTDLDAFPGNSGSPVLDAKTGVVEGILVRGPKANWAVEPVSNRLELRRLTTADAKLQGTHVQRISTIPEIAGGLQTALGLFPLISAGKTAEVLAALEADLDLTVRDAKKRSLLHVAMQHRQLEVARKLLDKEIPVLMRDERGATPLHAAARAGFKAGAELLIEYDLPINVINGVGETAWFIANDRGDEALAAYLLEEGADTRIQPNDAERFAAFPPERAEHWLEKALATESSGLERSLLAARCALTYFRLGHQRRARALAEVARKEFAGKPENFLCEQVGRAILIVTGDPAGLDRVLGKSHSWLILRVTGEDLLSQLRGDPRSLLRRYARPDNGVKMNVVWDYYWRKETSKAFERGDEVLIDQFLLPGLEALTARAGDKYMARATARFLRQRGDLDRAARLLGRFWDTPAADRHLYSGNYRAYARAQSEKNDHWRRELVQELVLDGNFAGAEKVVGRITGAQGNRPANRQRRVDHALAIIAKGHARAGNVEAMWKALGLRADDWWETHADCATSISTRRGDVSSARRLVQEARRRLDNKLQRGDWSLRSTKQKGARNEVARCLARVGWPDRAASLRSDWTVYREERRKLILDGLLWGEGLEGTKAWVLKQTAAPLRSYGLYRIGQRLADVQLKVASWGPSGKRGF